MSACVARVLVGVDLVEALDRAAMRVGVRAEDALDHAAARVEDDVHRALEAAHRRHLVDVRAHRPGVRAVVRLRRGDERAVVRLDRLVGDDAREDQLPAAARAPVVRLRLADRDLQVALGDRGHQPHRRAARGDADVRVGVGVPRVVLVERDPEPLHPVEVLAADLLLDVRLRHREDLPVRARDDGRLARRLDRVEHGRQQPRLRRRPELVVDHDRDLRRAREQLGEARPGDRRLERGPRRLGRVADRLGLVGVDRGEQVRVRDLELELLAVDLRLVARGADRQRVERLVRDLQARHGARGYTVPNHARHPDQPRLDRRRRRSTSPPASTRSSSAWSGSRPRSSRSRSSGCSSASSSSTCSRATTTRRRRASTSRFDVDDFDAVYAKAKEMGILDSTRVRLAAAHAPGRLGAAVPARPGRQPRRGRLARRRARSRRRRCADACRSSDACRAGRRRRARDALPLVRRRTRLKAGKPPVSVGVRLSALAARIPSREQVSSYLTWRRLPGAARVRADRLRVRLRPLHRDDPGRVRRGNWRTTTFGSAVHDPSSFLKIVLDSLTFAAALFIVASGFALIFGLMRVVNMAHGSFYLLGGYIAYEVQQTMTGQGFSLAVERRQHLGVARPARSSRRRASRSSGSSSSRRSCAGTRARSSARR